MNDIPEVYIYSQNSSNPYYTFSYEGDTTDKVDKNDGNQNNQSSNPSFDIALTNDGNQNNQSSNFNDSNLKSTYNEQENSNFIKKFKAPLITISILGVGLLLYLVIKKPFNKENEIDEDETTK